MSAFERFRSASQPQMALEDEPRVESPETYRDYIENENLNFIKKN